MRVKHEIIEAFDWGMFFGGGFVCSTAYWLITMPAIIGKEITTEWSIVVYIMIMIIVTAYTYMSEKVETVRHKIK